jgi:formate-dependent nitrite reductase membrane component NrfD
VRAPEAARLLVRAALAPLFWGGFIVFGLIAPAALEAFTWTHSRGYWSVLATAVAATLLLLGAFLMRQLILAAGIRRPLVARAVFQVRPTV